LRDFNQIEICLENCEWYIIPKECVKWFKVVGFNTILTYQPITGCSSYEQASLFELVVKDSDKIAPQEGWSERFYDRITKHSDITQVKIVFDDNSFKSFAVPWGEADAFNQCQLVKKYGDSVCITIDQSQRFKWGD